MRDGIRGGEGARETMSRQRWAVEQCVNKAGDRAEVFPASSNTASGLPRPLQWQNHPAKLLKGGKVNGIINLEGVK